MSLDSSGFTLEGSWESTGDPSDLLLARRKQRANQDNDCQKMLAQEQKFCGKSSFRIIQWTHSLRQILKDAHENTVDV